MEIIVIDNNSSDDTLQMLHQEFPEVIVIANKHNNGFAKANNQGFKICSAKYVFILNPDTVVKPGTLHALVDVLENDPTVGIVGPTLVLPNGEIQRDCARLLQNIGMTLFYETLHFNKLPIIGPIIIKHYLFPYDHSKAQPVEAVTGCACMLRSTTLQEIGGFYEEYLHCGEDLELSYTVNKMGLSNYYTPKGVVLHYDKGSSRQASVRISVNALISNELFFKRCKSNFQAFIYKYIILLIQIPLLFMFSVIRRVLGMLSKEEYIRRRNIVSAICKWKPISSDK